jgi:hypothetical protein
MCNNRQQALPPLAPFRPLSLPPAASIASLCKGLHRAPFRGGGSALHSPTRRQLRSPAPCTLSLLAISHALHWPSLPSAIHIHLCVVLHTQRTKLAPLTSLRSAAVVPRPFTARPFTAPPGRPHCRTNNPPFGGGRQLCWLEPAARSTHLHVLLYTGNRRRGIYTRAICIPGAATEPYCWRRALQAITSQPKAPAVSEHGIDTNEAPMDSVDR